MGGKEGESGVECLVPISGEPGAMSARFLFSMVFP